MFKKIISVVFIAVLSLSLYNGKIETAKADTNTTITVYSWEDYIDLGYEDSDVEGGLSESLTSRFSNDELKKSVIEQFEEESGITVNYVTFATNEEMYNELKNNPDGADLVCPSEYMILKMKDEGMLTPYAVPANWNLNGSPYIKQVFADLGLTSGAETYATGYMWGTMGYIYNTAVTNSQELKNWDSILDEKFNKRATIKDSIRDTYILAVGAVYEEELKALDKNDANYSNKIAEIFNRTDEETISKVEEFLKNLKGKLYGFEVDSGKNDMLNGKIDVNFAWSGDAVYAIDTAEEEGLTFEYVVPEEGSNVWFDGWVMPKNADKVNATKFLDFICSPEIAIRNMEYIGYTSCISNGIEDYVLENGDEDGACTLDLSYFFGSDFTVKTTSETGRLATQYPDFNTVKRCTVMKNFNDEELSKVNEMWNRVKFVTFPTWAIILIIAVVLLGVGGFVVYKFRDKIFAKAKRKGKLTVVKKEEVR